MKNHQNLIKFAQDVITSWHSLRQSGNPGSGKSGRPTLFPLRSRFHPARTPPAVRTVVRAELRFPRGEINLQSEHLLYFSPNYKLLFSSNLTIDFLTVFLLCLQALKI